MMHGVLVTNIILCPESYFPYLKTNLSVGLGREITREIDSIYFFQALMEEMKTFFNFIRRILIRKETENGKQIVSPEFFN